jgi:hypothetical protein
MHGPKVFRRAALVSLFKFDDGSLHFLKRFVTTMGYSCVFYDFEACLGQLTSAKKCIYFLDVW